MAVAIDHIREFKPLESLLRCRLRSIGHIPDLTAVEIGSFHSSRSIVKRSLSTPCFFASDDDRNNNHSLLEIIAGSRKPGVRALALNATIAVASGSEPVPAPGGLGGAYYLCNPMGKKIALVKPIVGVNGSMTRISASIPEAGIREVAAYLLDHDAFSGVPPTGLVRIYNAMQPQHSLQSPTMEVQTWLPKTASIQQFVPHEFDAGDLGPSSFSVSSVHRIGILDIRLLNVDRHAGNILVKNCARATTVHGPAELVPVDHGLCLPESLEGPYFEWLHWPQASIPFSDEEYEYIFKLDAARDAATLRNELPSLKECSIRVLIVCTIFLKAAALSGLCLADIGDMMSREFHGTEEESSQLEILCARAMKVLSVNASGRAKEERDYCQFDMETEETNARSLNSNDFGLASHCQHGQFSAKPPRPPPLLVSASSVSGNLQQVFSLIKGGSGSVHTGDTAEIVTTDGASKHTAHTRSLSISLMHRNHDSHGISFKQMNREDWEQFLERFELLLPQAFESRKHLKLNPRLGSSCKI